MTPNARKRRKSLAERIRESGGTTLYSLDESARVLQEIAEGIKPDKQVGEQVDEQIDYQPDEQVDRPIISSTISPMKSSTRLPSSSPSISPTTSPSFSPGSSQVYLSHNQAVLYLCLKALDGRPTNLRKISDATGISQHTLKSALNKLRKNRVVGYGGFCKFGKLSGFRATIRSSEVLFAGDKKRLAKLANELDYRSILIATNIDQIVDLSSTDHLADATSSSSYLYKETTTTTEVEVALTTHPELGYWRQKELTPRQIEDWMRTAGCSFENIIQSLCHCRFEMVDLGLEESKPIENVFNWFYKIIERAGYYPAPRGYRSFAEKEIERQREAIEEKERRITELKELSRKRWEKERDEKFWKMMADPEGDLYERCHGKLNFFEKNLKGGKVFEESMRRVFNEVIERDQEG